jgi:hypothetical protein
VVADPRCVVLFRFCCSRLHDNAPSEPQFGLSAWKWLKHDPLESAELLTQQQQQEDALYVLGVAGLASKRLLQKHHIPTPTTTTSTRLESVDHADVTQIVDVSVVPSSTSPTKLMLHKQAVALAFHRLSKSRMALHKYQNKQLRTMASFCVRGPIHLCQSLWRWGGGQRNVMRTLALTAAVMLVLVRPLLQIVASESLNMTRGA